MRILFVGAGYPPGSRGGTEIHMQQLAAALRRRGHEVGVFCRQGDPGREEYAEAEGEVDGVPVRRVNNLFQEARDLDWIFENAALDDALERHLDRFAPDLVHVHHLTCLSTRMLERVAARGLPLVMTLHDHWMVCPRGQRITPELEICTDLDRGRCAPCLGRLWPHFDVTPSRLEALDGRLRQRLRACDRLLFPSAFHRERFLEQGLDPDRLVVVEHGLDHELIPDAARPERPLRRVGFIGSVIPTKGVHVLVDAINRIGDPEVECHVHGEALPFHGDTAYLDRLKARAREDLEFHWHGAYAQEELPRILSGLDLVVVPSLWWESFCLTIREAMLAGVPVLASDLGAMHEALADLGEDLLFRPGDGQDLAWKIEALRADPERRARVARLRPRVRTLDAMARQTEGIYRAVAGDPDARRAARERLASVKRRGAERPYATVFFPTWNGGPLFERILDRVLAQETDFDFEVLCIDSGSRDGTVDVIRARPRVRLIEIPNAEFNHGLTRNRAIEEARGEIVVLLTQDAEPADTRWLQTFVDDFDDPEVAGAYCHQVPREDCNPFQRDRLRGWTRGEGRPERKRLVDRAAWEAMHPYDRYRLIAFDNVASGVRASVMRALPFTERQFGEDVTWAKAAILAGHTLVMDPRAVVIHSHDNPMWYEFKRVYLDHQNLNDLVGLRTVPTPWAVCKCSVHATGTLWRAVWRDDRGLLYRAWWTLKTPLYAFLQNLAQYLGAGSMVRRDAAGWRLVDRLLRRGV